MNTENNKNDVLKDMYKSAIRASYFGGMNNPQFLKKSALNIKDISNIEEKQVDEKTFRMMKGFKKFEQSYKVFIKKATVYIDSSGFCCFGKRRPYVAEVSNAKFSIKNGQQIIKFVNFNAVSTKVLEKSNFIYIQFEGRPKEQRIQFQLQDKSQSEHKKWTHLLYQIIHQSLGAQNHYTYLAQTCPEFYKTEQVLLSEFEAKANTGDILLFRSPHGAARAQRLLTNSEYGKLISDIDHVGLVLRNLKNQLFVFQSSSDEGVGMYPWRHMVQYKWYDECQKICWRPLTADLTDFEVDIVQAFVAKTLGKGFQINLNKLFQLTSKLQRSKEEEQKKTYFCSELVARLYKQLKFIDSQKSSTSYYPIDFSNKGSIRFTRNEIKLGNEKIIAFER